MSFIIKIPSLHKEIPAQQGELLHKVLQRAGMDWEAPCGGQGTCGRCAVQIISGRYGQLQAGRLSEKMRREDWALSCQTIVTDDLTINLGTKIKTTDTDLFAFQMPPLEISIPLLTPLSKKYSIKDESILDEHPITDEDVLRKFLPADCGRDIPAAVLQQLSSVLRDASHSLTLVTGQFNGEQRLIDVQAGNRTDKHFGIACDIGTTTVAMSLIDLKDGFIIDSASTYNNQIICGADVISRIIYSQKSGHLLELQERIGNTIDRLLQYLLAKNDVRPEQVLSAVLSGNTTMTHLLLGINPKFIREEPYTPVVKYVPVMPAGELKIAVHPQAPVFCSPAVGSYVGGDITSGVLCAQYLIREKGIHLFIDIGTNGELVMMGDDWLMGCACSAGPAFEGVGIRCGMRAADGAIDLVKIAANGDLSFHVIGDVKPGGICGSGLIDLLAELFSAHIIGRDGKFHDNASTRIKHSHRLHRFILASAEESGDGREIFISEHDIDNLVRAKAAVFSAISLLLAKVGLTFSDIQKIFIAGGFGSRINIQNAIKIGLFPNLPLQRFSYLGNTSLYGAYLSLLSQENRDRLVDIARSMTYIDLSSEPNYMHEYMAALFLPHTDERLFGGGTVKV